MFFRFIIKTYRETSRPKVFNKKVNRYNGKYYGTYVDKNYYMFDYYDKVVEELKRLQTLIFQGDS